MMEMQVSLLLYLHEMNGDYIGRAQLHLFT